MSSAVTARRAGETSAAAGASPASPSVPALSAGETVAVLADVVAPLIARGVIARRPRVVDVLDRLDADRRAVGRMQELRDSYEEGPVRLRIPGRDVALILAAPDVRRVLEESPEPFATASREKRAALSRFQPHGVLISHGAERAERRRFNEDVLETGRPVHSLARDLVRKLQEETGLLAGQTRASGWLTWDDFAVAWWRVVRRVVLGDRAREDHAITDMLARLRADANWAQLGPRRRRLQQRFLDRLRAWVSAAEPGSLSSVATSASSDGVSAEEQMAHWLFAFDAAGMASFRALALLDAHPRDAARAREEAAATDLAAPEELPFLRACVLESLRLWPTTPAVLRDTTDETVWRNGMLASGSAVVVFAPFFHRDDQRLSFADSFEPSLWLDGQTAGDWPLIPFSQGPAECPGRDLVLLLTSSLLGIVLSELDLRLDGVSSLTRQGRLPATLSPFRLRFRAAPSRT